MRASIATQYLLKNGTHALANGRITHDYIHTQFNDVALCEESSPALVLCYGRLRQNMVVGHLAHPRRPWALQTQNLDTDKDRAESVLPTSMDHVPPALVGAVPVTRPDDELIILPVKQPSAVSHRGFPMIPVALKDGTGRAGASLHMQGQKSCFP